MYQVFTYQLMVYIFVITCYLTELLESSVLDIKLEDIAQIAQVPFRISAGAQSI